MWSALYTGLRQGTGVTVSAAAKPCGWWAVPAPLPCTSALASACKPAHMPVNQSCPYSSALTQSSLTARPYLMCPPPQRNQTRSTIKITGMQLPYDQIDGARLCFTLRGRKDKGNCPTLPLLAHPLTAKYGSLEIGLYDQKQGYECCPVSTDLGPPLVHGRQTSADCTRTPTVIRWRV